MRLDAVARCCSQPIKENAAIKLFFDLQTAIKWDELLWSMEQIASKISKIKDVTVAAVNSAKDAYGRTVPAAEATTKLAKIEWHPFRTCCIQCVFRSWRVNASVCLCMRPMRCMRRALNAICRILNVQ